MIYLPVKLSVEQVTEAHQLVPAMDGSRRKGTVIVSVTDEASSANNPEHVKVANSIEVRLADRGCFPSSRTSKSDIRWKYLGQAASTYERLGHRCNGGARLVTENY